MDIVYYRKIAELLLREVREDDPRPPDSRSSAELREVGQRGVTDRNLKKRDKRILRAWMYLWIDARTKKEHQP